MLCSMYYGDDCFVIVMLVTMMMMMMVRTMTRIDTRLYHLRKVIEIMAIR